MLATNCNIRRTVGSWPEPASYLDGCQDVTGVLHRVWLHHCKGPAAGQQLLRHEARVILNSGLPKAQCASLHAPFAHQAHQAQQQADRGQLCWPVPASYRGRLQRSRLEKSDGVKAPARHLVSLMSEVSAARVTASAGDSTRSCRLHTVTLRPGVSGAVPTPSQCTRRRKVLRFFASNCTRQGKPGVGCAGRGDAKTSLRDWGR